MEDEVEVCTTNREDTKDAREISPKRVCYGISMQSTISSTSTPLQNESQPPVRICTSEPVDSFFAILQDSDTCSNNILASSNSDFITGPQSLTGHPLLGSSDHTSVPQMFSQPSLDESDSIDTSLIVGNNLPTENFEEECTTLAIEAGIPIANDGVVSETDELITELTKVRSHKCKNKCGEQFTEDEIVANILSIRKII